MSLKNPIIQVVYQNDLVILVITDISDESKFSKRFYEERYSILNP